MDDFKDILKEWLDLDDEIRQNQKEIKDKKSRLNKL